MPALPSRRLISTKRGHKRGRVRVNQREGNVMIGGYSETIVKSSHLCKDARANPITVSESKNKVPMMITDAAPPTTSARVSFDGTIHIQHVAKARRNPSHKFHPFAPAINLVPKIVDNADLRRRGAGLEHHRVQRSSNLELDILNNAINGTSPTFKPHKAPRPPNFPEAEDARVEGKEPKGGAAIKFGNHRPQADRSLMVMPANIQHRREPSPQMASQATPEKQVIQDFNIWNRAARTSRSHAVN